MTGLLRLGALLSKHWNLAAGESLIEQRIAPGGPVAQSREHDRRLPEDEARTTPAAAQW